MRTYVLPRATFTIQHRDRAPLNHMSKIMAYESIKAAKNKLKRTDLSENQKIEFKSRVADGRARLRRSYVDQIQVTVKLTDKQFLGHTEVYDLEISNTFSLHRALGGRIRETIRNFRARRSPNTSIQPWSTFRIEFMGLRPGRVFAKPNTIFKAYVSKNMKELFADKKPVEPVKYLGIELEFCAPIAEEELASRLFKAGLQKVAQLKKDASLRPHEKEMGYELALLLKESTYKKDLKSALDVLRSVGAVTEDRRCGLHVHLDMRKRNKNTVFNNLVACQSILKRLVDPRRHNNEFCQSVKKRTPPTNFKGNRNDRYKTINAASYYKYQTLEVRMHEGSVDFNLIAGWTDLLVKIANCRQKLTKTIRTLTMLKRMLKLNEKAFTYAVDRNCYWQLQQPPRRPQFETRFTTMATTEPPDIA